MTKEEFRNLLMQFGVEVSSRHDFIYVFYQDNKGLINNFSISMRCAKQGNRHFMKPEHIADLMAQYPRSRDCQILAIEHPRDRASIAGQSRGCCIRRACSTTSTTVPKK